MRSVIFNAIFIATIILSSGSFAKNDCMTLEQLDNMIPLSKPDVKKLKENKLTSKSLYFKREPEPGPGVSVCYYYIDLSPTEECGSFDDYAEYSPTKLRSSKFTKDDYTSGDLISRVSDLRDRSQQVPELIRVLGRSNADTIFLADKLKANYLSAQAALNTENNIKEKWRIIEPIIIDSAKASRKLAKAANFNNNILSGCGAGEEDSQVVFFKINPKPVSARYISQYEFDLCASITNDPYDSNKCDAWKSLQPNENYFSGNYRYRIAWPDGSVKTEKISFSGTKKRTINIEK